MPFESDLLKNHCLPNKNTVFIFPVRSFTAATIKKIAFSMNKNSKKACKEMATYLYSNVV